MQEASFHAEHLIWGMRPVGHIKRISSDDLAITPGARSQKGYHENRMPSGLTLSQPPANNVMPLGIFPGQKTDTRLYSVPQPEKTTGRPWQDSLGVYAPRR